MKIVKTFTAEIAVGFHERDSGKDHSITEAIAICQKYCDEVGLCVTVTGTRYVYTNGGEYGCLIRLINYPRFPSTQKKILGHATVLAKQLLDEFKQYKVSIICPKKTYMIESEREVSRKRT